jgi:hypothetical protein
MPLDVSGDAFPRHPGGKISRYSFQHFSFSRGRIAGSILRAGAFDSVAVILAERVGVKIASGLSMGLCSPGSLFTAISQVSGLGTCLAQAGIAELNIRPRRHQEYLG